MAGINGNGVAAHNGGGESVMCNLKWHVMML